MSSSGQYILKFTSVYKNPNVFSDIPHRFNEQMVFMGFFSTFVDLVKYILIKQGILCVAVDSNQQWFLYPVIFCNILRYYLPIRKSS